MTNDKTEHVHITDGNCRPVAAVVGPTASGKTALAIALARRFDGEIVSCDSMQIYRGMDIGTAKPTAQERAQAPHHMIDIADPGEEYSCARYAAEAGEAIREIQKRGKLPILCGGTGLYLDSVLLPDRHAAPQSDPALRQELRKKTPSERYDLLLRVDPESANATHPNNEIRVIRALEIYLLSGKTKTQWDLESQAAQPAFRAAVIGLDYADRTLLYARIDRRVDEMLERGLADEVKKLDLPPDSTAGQAIGYKEMRAYLAGDCTLEEAAAQIKTASRNYAKRQLTWFRRRKDICWLYPDKSHGFEEIVNNASDFLTNEKICDIIR